MTPVLRLHPGLSGSSRLQRRTRIHDVTSATEWATLLGIGVITAAISTLVDLHLRIPGHAILKVVFPVAAGMALVPRRGAGTIIGMSAFAAAMSLRMGGFGGVGLGFGALTSLTAIGPILDLMLRHARSSRSIYIGFVLGGLASNLLALFVRGVMKGIGLEHAGGRPLGLWLSQAAVTYTLCGIVAGLASASVWFCVRANQRTEKRTDAQEPTA